MEFLHFFFRMLTLAKKNYWLIKIEIVGFIWVVKKIRHMIK